MPMQKLNIETCKPKIFENSPLLLYTSILGTYNDLALKKENVYLELVSGVSFGTLCIVKCSLKMTLSKSLAIFHHVISKV